MKRLVLLIVLALIPLCLPPSAGAQEAGGRSGEVEVRRVEPRDEKRDRVVPVKYYIPPGATERGPMPLVLLSHGLGGTREVASYLGECWARRGYVVAALQHAGSDDSVWRGVPAAGRMDALRTAMQDPAHALNRPRDISFVIDTLLAEHDRGEGVGAMIDPERIAAAGHSFGAYTVLAIAGQRFGPRGGSLGDPRVKAVIAMSSQAPRIDPAEAYRDITIPILHLTGTEDRSPVDPAVTPEDRQAAFRGISAPDQYLVVFDGADHGVFSGVGRRQRDAAQDQVVQSLVQQSSTMFLDAFLKCDEAALAQIRGEALAELVGRTGKVERK